jgi:hypothetical protein
MVILRNTVKQAGLQEYSQNHQEIKSYRPFERESPLLQGWDDSEIELGTSSDVSKVHSFVRIQSDHLFSERQFIKIYIQIN